MAINNQRVWLQMAGLAVQGGSQAAVPDLQKVQKFLLQYCKVPSHLS